MANWWLEPKYNRKPYGAVSRRPHAMHTLKNITKPVCRHCGLVALNNAATRHALRQGCWKYADEK